MIKYIALLVVAAFFLVMGPNFADKQGLLHIEFCDYVIETSLVTAVIMLVVVLFCFFLVSALVKKLLKVKSGASSWLAKRRGNNATRQLENSMLSYIEGDYAECFKSAQKSAEKSSVPLVSAVMMAISGIKTGNEDACEALIKEAEKRGDVETSHALSLVRVQNYMAQGNFAAAYALASVLFASAPKSRKLSEIMLRCAISLDKSDEVCSLLAKILKAKALTISDCIDMAGGYLANIIHGLKDKAELKSFLDTIPSVLREESLFIDAVAARMSMLHEESSAAKMIIRELRASENSDEIYARIANWSIGNEPLLRYLEKQMPAGNSASSSLLSALANLYLRSGNVSQARDLYERVVLSGCTPKDYLNLAGIYEAQGCYKEATTLYKRLGTGDTSVPVKA